VGGGALMGFAKRDLAPRPTDLDTACQVTVLDRVDRLERLVLVLQQELAELKREMERKWGDGK